MPGTDHCSTPLSKLIRDFSSSASRASNQADDKAATLMRQANDPLLVHELLSHRDFRSSKQRRVVPSLSMNFHMTLAPLEREAAGGGAGLHVLDPILEPSYGPAFFVPTVEDEACAICIGAPVRPVPHRTSGWAVAPVLLTCLAGLILILLS